MSRSLMLLYAVAVQCMQVSAEISSADGSLKLRASGTQVLFAGHLKAYEDFDTGKQASSGMLVPAPCRQSRPSVAHHPGTCLVHFTRL